MKVGVTTASRDQVVVSTALDDATALEHQDAVCLTEGRQSMRDVQCCRTAHQEVESILDGLLGL